MSRIAGDGFHKALQPERQRRVRASVLVGVCESVSTLKGSPASHTRKEEVTTFTLSDFGRTFQPSSRGGTDHAWGNHHFIIGDAVHGGAFYGQYLQLALGGPSDVETRGRWLPTTSVDQYGSTLAKCFGVAPADLGFVFPNLGKFASCDLGFIG